MNHLLHLEKNKKNLDLRWKILRLIREFFWEKDFVEVETPFLLATPGMEPYLDPMKLLVSNERGEEYPFFLHTSPEFTMKKFLAAGEKRIFSLGKCFRNFESFGSLHNPEFTMLEWYAAGQNYFDLMLDTESFISYIAKGIDFKEEFSFEKRSVKELWEKYLGLDLDDYLDKDSLFELVKEKGYNPQKNESYADLFFRIFLNEIEPNFKDFSFLFVVDYPAPLAALAKLSEKNCKYAERFELYYKGVELANAFSELTNADEQRKRFEEEQELRKKLGKEIFGIDEDFLFAVENMPDCAGIALGVDRLVQIFSSCKNIDNVVPLPMSLQIKK